LFSRTVSIELSREELNSVFCEVICGAPPEQHLAVQRTTSAAVRQPTQCVRQLACTAGSSSDADRFASGRAPSTTPAVEVVYINGAGYALL